MQSETIGRPDDICSNPFEEDATMEQQLNTRTIMTGGVFLAAFFAACLLHHCPAQLMYTISRNNYATLLVALLSAPFVGWAIGAIVISKNNLLHGRTYIGPTRNRAKEWMEERLRNSLKGNSKLGNWFENEVKGDDIFAYMMNSENPVDIIEWGRRQHTARSIGMNWSFATILGVVFGISVGPYNWLPKGSPFYIFWLLVLVAAIAVFVNGKRAGKAIENVERMWLEDFIAQHKKHEDEPKKSTKKKDVSVLFDKKALRRWNKNLSEHYTD